MVGWDQEEEQKYHSLSLLETCLSLCGTCLWWLWTCHSCLWTCDLIGILAKLSLGPTFALYWLRPKYKRTHWSVCDVCRCVNRCHTRGSLKYMSLLWSRVNQRFLKPSVCCKETRGTETVRQEDRETLRETQGSMVIALEVLCMSFLLLCVRLLIINVAVAADNDHQYKKRYQSGKLNLINFYWTVGDKLFQQYNTLVWINAIFKNWK